ncbi:sporulation kinase E [Acrasis kona]|uniref:Sporulation kinase E n=1 Tax=Acrasis kona TaxID=1008807 RepID=A0AAW2ZDT2_9EUKA
MQKSIQASITALSNTQSLFNITDELIDQNVFMQFQVAPGPFPKNIHVIGFLLYLPKSTFEMFRNLTDGTLRENLFRPDLDTYYKNSPNNTFYPLIMVAPDTPEFLSTIGVDSGRDSRIEKIQKAIDTKQVIATSRINFPDVLIGGRGVSMYKAVFSRIYGDLAGLVTITIEPSELLNDAFGTSVEDWYISLRDANDSQPTQFLYNTKTDVTNLEQDVKFLNLFEVQSTEYVAFADRTWSLTFVATENYIQKNSQSFSKYIGIITSMIVMLVALGCCVVLFFGRRLLNAHRLRVASKERIKHLNNNQSKLRVLFKRIMAQEERTNSILNALTDVIIVLDNNGRVIRTNNAFDTVFRFPNEMLEKGLMIGSIITDAPDNFFRNECRFDTKCTDGFEQKVSCNVTVTCLRDRERHTSVLIEAIIGDQGKQDGDEESYLVVLQLEQPTMMAAGVSTEDGTDVSE